MAYGITRCEIDTDRHGNIRGVDMEFSEGFRLTIQPRNAQPVLVLQAGRQRIALPIDGNLCLFQRAVNLVSLHLPQSRR
jgi:hypothetical protein